MVNTRFALKADSGTSVVVQWLRLCAPNAEGPGFNPWSGNQVPHTTIRSLHAAVKIKILCATNKTQHIAKKKKKPSKISKLEYRFRFRYSKNRETFVSLLEFIFKCGFHRDHNLALSFKLLCMKPALWILNFDKKISINYQWPNIITVVQYLFCLSFGNSTWFSLNDCPAPNLKAIKRQF